MAKRKHGWLVYDVETEVYVGDMFDVWGELQEATPFRTRREARKAKLPVGDRVVKVSLGANGRAKCIIPGR